MVDERDRDTKEYGWIGTFVKWRVGFSSTISALERKKKGGIIGRVTEILRRED
jgi:hypothetical protein